MFCSFHFYLWLPSPLKPCCEIKNTSVTRQEGRACKLKKDLQQLNLKQKNTIEAQCLTSLFSLPSAVCTEIICMIDNRLNKFSTLTIQGLITWRT